VLIEGQEGRLLAGGDLPLDGVDFLKERAVLALRADLVDLLLVLLELFLRVLDRRFRRSPLPGSLGRRFLEALDLFPLHRVLLVELTHPVGNSVQSLIGLVELGERCLQLQDVLEILIHGKTSAPLRRNTIAPPLPATAGSICS
jgi:hypothetical protein